MIRLENVTYLYPEQTEPAIRRLSLEISPGEFVAVIGPNGSGKSTLARLLNGMLMPFDGKVTVEGLNTSDQDSLRKIRCSVGLVLQNPESQFVGSTVLDDIAFGPENLGLSPEEIGVRVNQALTHTGMTAFKEVYPRELSGGQKQKVAIAGVLAMRPRYLVLDEATSMLDITGRNEVLETILHLRERGIGSILMTHNLNEASLADKIVVLVNGTLTASGTPREILTDAGLLADCGLRASTIVRITGELRKNGCMLPAGILTQDDLLEGLCSLK